MNRRYFLLSLPLLAASSAVAAAPRRPRPFRWDIATHQWQEIPGFPRTLGAILWLEGWTCIAVVQDDGAPEYVGLPKEIFSP